MVTLLSFIFVLGIIVFIHELGHFLAAKMCGMRVEIFSLGFGKKIIGKKIGETEYKIAWIPLGGYVKISGMVDEFLDPEGGIKGESYEFESKNSFQKAFVISAGVLMNFILAFVIYTALSYHDGTMVVDKGNFIADFTEKSPAQQAGLLKNDKIVKIDNKVINSWEELATYIHDKPDTKIAVSVLRGNEVLIKDIFTYSREIPLDGKMKNIGLIGIIPKMNKIDLTIWGSVKNGVNSTVAVTQLGFMSIKMLVSGEASINDLGGPILIAQMSGESARQGFESLMAFIAFISINIGFLNILPLPVLDGGHLAIIIIEGISRKKINMNFKMRIQQIGIILLLTLMGFAMFNDIKRAVNKDSEVTIKK